MSNDIKANKREIVNSIKDLDRSDYIDICMLLKSNLSSYEMINELPKGTFIDLDMIDESLVLQLYNMITTKLQRIAER